tara:strand:- start:7035 stop:7574 length:540 start_codon:yes stop_codon:yes gene_type:complete
MLARAIGWGVGFFLAKKLADSSGDKIPKYLGEHLFKTLFKERTDGFEELLIRSEQKESSPLSEEYVYSETGKVIKFLSLLDLKMKANLQFFEKESRFRLKAEFTCKGVDSKIKLQGRYEHNGQVLTFIPDEAENYDVLPREYRDRFSVIVKHREGDDIELYFNEKQKTEQKPIRFIPEW